MKQCEDEQLSLDSHFEQSKNTFGPTGCKSWCGMKRIDWHILETLNDLCLWDAPVFPMIGHFYVSINPTMGGGRGGFWAKGWKIWWKKKQLEKSIKINQNIKQIHTFMSAQIHRSGFIYHGMFEKHWNLQYSNYMFFCAKQSCSFLNTLITYFPRLYWNFEIDEIFADDLCLCDQKIW